MSAHLLEERTGENVEVWNRRVRGKRFRSESDLRAWLTARDVTGYAQSLLVMEQFGYPDYYLASADELINGQYKDRPHLRPIVDALIDAAAGVGEVTVQARKGYVSLVTPRRTFARVQATTKNRVNLSLRLKDQKPRGRLRPSKLHESMGLEMRFTVADEVDSEVLSWLQKAYEQNR